MNKNQIIAAIGITAFCITIIVSVVVLLNTPIYIKNLGSSVEQNGIIVNTINVSGDGKVTVKPDMATINFSISELASTSELALDNANAKINELTSILKNNGVQENDIQTTQFNIYPEYDYSRLNEPIIKGQRATIGVTAKIKGIDITALKVTKVIDEASKIDKIQMGSIYFDLENKESSYNKARELAFNKAKQKAEDLARLSGVSLLTPVSITDLSSSIANPSPVPFFQKADALSSASNNSTSLSTGELELSISLNVVFGIE